MNKMLNQAPGLVVASSFLELMQISIQWLEICGYFAGGPGTTVRGYDDVIAILKLIIPHMNHLNKQLEVNHAALEQYLAEQDRKERVQQRLDRLGLSLMILCGLIGLFYCLANANTIFKKSEKDAFGLKFPNEPYQYAIAGISQANKQEKDTPLNTEVETKQTFVNISGTPRAGQTLQFLLDDYYQEAEYKLHLGNGDVRRAQTNQMTYAYAEAGSYEVILEVSYRGETAIAFSKILTID